MQGMLINNGKLGIREKEEESDGRKKEAKVWNDRIVAVKIDRHGGPLVRLWHLFAPVRDRKSALSPRQVATIQCIIIV